MPLQYGGFAALGLAGWSFAGLSSWILELINVSTGLPWFHTIIANILFSRLLLHPFYIKQLCNSAALAPRQPRQIELKKGLYQAYKAGDKRAVQRVALKQRKAYEEWREHVVHVDAVCAGARHTRLFFFHLHLHTTRFFLSR